MIYVTLGTITIILFLLVVYVVYKLSKEIAVLDIIKEENERYEKDKKIINRNNNLAHDELINKLRKLQYKK